MTGRLRQEHEGALIYGIIVARDKGGIMVDGGDGGLAYGRSNLFMIL